MKTKKINVTSYPPKPEPVTVEEEVIDRDYYASKIQEKEVARGQLVIEVQGGIVQNVYNHPGETYSLIDWDHIKDMTELEFLEWIRDMKYNVEELDD